MSERILKPALAVLLAVGEILIISGFYILVPERARGNVFFLNMLVVSSVYLFNMFSFLDFFPAREEMDRKVAGLGIKWFFILLYSAFALFIMIIGLITTVPFKYQLVLQLAAVLVLMIGLVLSALTGAKAQRLAGQQADDRNRKQQINDILLKLALDLKKTGSGYEASLKKIEALREKNRMLTVSNLLTAQELENEIINELSNLSKIILFSDKDDTKIVEGLDRCQILFDQRKQFSTN